MASQEKIKKFPPLVSSDNKKQLPTQCPQKNLETSEDDYASRRYGVHDMEPRNSSSEYYELNERSTKSHPNMKLNVSDELSDLERSGPLDLISLLASRLAKTEIKLQQTEQKLAMTEKSCKKKDIKISELQKISHLKKSASPTSEGSSVSLVSPKVYDEELDFMESKCERLKMQMNEMVRFLADYGLIWVGDSYKGKQAGPPDFLKFVQCVEELNQLVGYGEPQLTYTNNGASFKNPESLPLLLYADGLVLFSGPFRAYSNHATHMFIQDILDGFFPSELQHAYPDGVCFKVTDRHEVYYKTRRKWKPFEGKGYTLGAQEQKPNKRIAAENVSTDKKTKCTSSASGGDSNSPKPEWKSSILNTVCNTSLVRIDETGKVLNNVCREDLAVQPQKLKTVFAFPKKMEHELNPSSSALKRSKCDSCSSSKSSTTSVISVKSSTKQKAKLNNKTVCFKENIVPELRKSSHDEKMLAVCKTKSSSTVKNNDKANVRKSCENISKSRPTSPCDKVKCRRYKRDNSQIAPCNSTLSEENVASKPADSASKQSSSSRTKRCSKSNTLHKNSLTDCEKESKPLSEKKSNLDLETNKMSRLEDGHTPPPFQGNSTELGSFQTNKIVSNYAVGSELGFDGDRNNMKEESNSKCSKNLFKEKLNAKNTCSTTLLNKNSKHHSSLHLINEEINLDVSTSQLSVTTDLTSQSVDVLIEKVVPPGLDVDISQTLEGNKDRNLRRPHREQKTKQRRLATFNDHNLNEGTVSGDGTASSPKSIRMKKCKSILSNQTGSTPLLKEIDKFFLAASSRLTALEVLEAEVMKNVADPLGTKLNDQMKENALTEEEFVKKLPSKVVRNGKLIDIRGGVAEILKESAPVTFDIHSNPSKTNFSEEITLKVRSENGGEIYMVHMFPSETVGTLYRLLGQMRVPESDSSIFTLVSKRSPKDQVPLLDRNLTLRESNLAFNSVLYMKSSV